MTLTPTLTLCLYVSDKWPFGQVNCPPDNMHVGLLNLPSWSRNVLAAGPTATVPLGSLQFFPDLLAGLIFFGTRGVQRLRGLLASVKSHKLKHFGHTARHNSLAKTSCWVQCREKDARQARRNSGQMTLESGRVSPFRTWSTWRKTEKRIVNSFIFATVFV